MGENPRMPASLQFLRPIFFPSPSLHLSKSLLPSFLPSPLCPTSPPPPPPPPLPPLSIFFSWRRQRMEEGGSGTFFETNIFPWEEGRRGEKDSEKREKVGEKNNIVFILRFFCFRTLLEIFQMFCFSVRATLRLITAVSWKCGWTLLCGTKLS